MMILDNEFKKWLHSIMSRMPKAEHVFRLEQFNLLYIIQSG